MWASRQLNRSLAPPDWLTVNLTLRCNLRCVMCTTCYDSPELSTAEILDLIDQAAAWGVRIFNPLGGEPFVRPDLETILAHAARRDLHTTLTTNGTLINEARAALVARIPIEKLHLNVSLDGPQEAHDRVRGEGTWARAMAGYHRLREAEPARRKIGCNSILHRGNLDGFLDWVDTLDAEGFDQVQVLHLFRSRDDDTVGGMWFLPEDLPRLERVVEALAEHPRVVNSAEDLRLVPRYYRDGLAPLEAPCWAGWKELYVNADGSVIMCDGKLDFLAGRVGDVRRQTLRQVWASDTLRARRAVVKSCTTPCIQNCYLRRESDAVMPLLTELLPRPRPGAVRTLAETLTLEVCDIPADPGHVRLRSFFARSPVPAAVVLADPERLAELRDRAYVEFGRGFLGVAVAERILEEVAAAGLRFETINLSWRGNAGLHPELPELIRRVARFGRPVVVEGTLLTAAARATLAEVGGTIPAVPEGLAISWEGRVVASTADVGLRALLGDALKEPFSRIQARR